MKGKGKHAYIYNSLPNSKATSKTQIVDEVVLGQAYTFHFQQIKDAYWVNLELVDNKLISLASLVIHQSCAWFYIILFIVVTFSFLLLSNTDDQKYFRFLKCLPIFIQICTLNQTKSQLDSNSIHIFGTKHIYLYVYRLQLHLMFFQ